MTPHLGRGSLILNPSTALGATQLPRVTLFSHSIACIYDHGDVGAGLSAVHQGMCEAGKRVGYCGEGGGGSWALTLAADRQPRCGAAGRPPRSCRSSRHRRENSARGTGRCGNLG